ncbi:MAG: hypothetical protein ACFFCZ_13450 [Promethearchaeota archaeon]
MDFKKPDKDVVKALMFSLYPVLKTNQIKMFGFEILEDCLSRSVLEEIGFEYDAKGGAFVYTFEKD